MEYAFVKVSSKNQIVIPQDVMNEARIKEGEKLLARATNGQIELVKISEDPLETIQKANLGKEAEIREVIKEALKWKK